MRRVAITLLALPLLGAAPRKSMTIAVDASRIVTVNPDSNSVSIVDVWTLTKTREIAVCATPQSMSVDGDRAFVVCRDGKLNEVDLSVGRVVRSADAGYDPFGVLATSDRVYVAVGGESRVVVFDRATLKAARSIATEEFPRGLAMEGASLYVTHFRSGKLSVIDTASLQVSAVIATNPDVNLSQSVAISDGIAYLPQTRSNVGSPMTVFNDAVFPMVSAVDLINRRNLAPNRIAIELVDQPNALPIDAAINSKGTLVVVDAGSDDAAIFDASRRTLIAHVQVGSSPRGVALSPDESTAYVNNTLSGTISVIDLTSGKVTATVKTTTIPLAPDILNGKILFNTGDLRRMAKDRWMSCASCHFDGGTDGRTWLFRDGPRNTPALFGVSETLPLHWSGDLDELQDVESTIRVIQAGTGLTSSKDGNCSPACNAGAPNSGQSKDLDDLAAYMRTLQPPPRPVATMSAAAMRGQTLFNDARTSCASCHAAPLFTDRAKHDVGTGRGDLVEHKGTSFDTPSLRGLADSAPYFHDGTATTLLDVVRGANGLHGDTRALTAGEKNDLAEFLRDVTLVSTHRRSAPH
jgi:YVTN family beta-propeller protein